MIELLVVVAIIAVLVSMLIPSLQGARQQAKMVACGQNQRQAAIAIITYGQDQGEYPTRTTWEAQAASRGHEAVGSGYEPFQNLLIAMKYSIRGALQCSEKTKYPGCNSWDEFVSEPWYRYNSPSTVGYWVWHYGHGVGMQYFGWHWYSWNNPPYSSSRGPSVKKPTPKPAGDFHGTQALGCCPRSLICPPDWSFGYAHEPHLNRPRSANTPTECQFGEHATTTLARNYFFIDGHVEAVVRP